MLQDILTAIVEFVKGFGYLGIFIMTFIESSFVPIPAEVTMIPAGYLVSQGEMKGLWVMVASSLGTVGGALLNYYIARRFGRDLLLRYSRWFFITEAKLIRMEEFFADHGAISTFTGRLLPGVRHFISFPAGLARMHLGRFCFFTALGGALWMFALLMVGYFLGENEAVVKQYIPILTGKVMLGVVVLVTAYLLYHRRRKKTRNS